MHARLAKLLLFAMVHTLAIIIICPPQKLLMLRPKAFWVCGRMARRLVGAVVPRSVHANLNMGLFLRAVLCSTTPLPAYKIDFRAQKSLKFSRGLRPRTPGRLPLLGRTCLSGFGPVRPQSCHGSGHSLLRLRSDGGGDVGAAGTADGGWSLCCRRCRRCRRRTSQVSEAHRSESPMS